ncbi:MFS transporter [Humibacter ginsenosidimutans]|nr:MFS transporter [Humibacter ginsenosidimutans]
MPSTRRWGAVLAIALGTFVLVTNEFLPVGLLPQIAGSLGVSPVIAGTMVTAPAIVAAVAAPLLTVAAGALDRKLFLVGMMVTFTIADALAAFAATFTVMLIARIVLGAGIGGFWAIGGTLGNRLVGARYAGRATAIIFGGISVATVIGVPAAVAVGLAAGWRAAFAATAVLALGALVLLLILLPTLGAGGAVRWKTLTTLLRSRAARIGLFTTILSVTGHFVGYTFISAFLLSRVGMSPAALTLGLFVFGVAGLTGNFLVGPLARRHLRTTVATAIVLIAGSAGVLAVAADTWMSVILMGAWGLGYGAVPVALQTWIGAAAPKEFEAASSLYIASFQGSIATGSLVGGLAVGVGGTPTALIVGAALAASAAVAFVVTTRPRTTRSHIEIAATMIDETL